MPKTKPKKKIPSKTKAKTKINDQIHKSSKEDPNRSRKPVTRGFKVLTSKNSQSRRESVKQRNQASKTRKYSNPGLKPKLSNQPGRRTVAQFQPQIYHNTWYYAPNPAASEYFSQTDDNQSNLPRRWSYRRPQQHSYNPDMFLYSERTPPPPPPNNQPENLTSLHLLPPNHPALQIYRDVSRVEQNHHFDSEAPTVSQVAPLQGVQGDQYPFSNFIRQHKPLYPVFPKSIYRAHRSRNPPEFPFVEKSDFHSVFDSIIPAGTNLPTLRRRRNAPFYYHPSIPQSALFSYAQSHHPPVIPKPKEEKAVPERVFPRKEHTVTPSKSYTAILNNANEQINKRKSINSETENLQSKGNKSKRQASKTKESSLLPWQKKRSQLGKSSSSSNNPNQKTVEIDPESSDVDDRNLIQSPNKKTKKRPSSPRYNIPFNKIDNKTFEALPDLIRRKSGKISFSTHDFPILKDVFHPGEDFDEDAENIYPFQVLDADRPGGFLPIDSDNSQDSGFDTSVSTLHDSSLLNPQESLIISSIQDAPDLVDTDENEEQDSDSNVDAYSLSILSVSGRHSTAPGLPGEISQISLLGVQDVVVAGKGKGKGISKSINEDEELPLLESLPTEIISLESESDPEPSSAPIPRNPFYSVENSNNSSISIPKTTQGRTPVSSTPKFTPTISKIVRSPLDITAFTSDNDSESGEDGPVSTVEVPIQEDTENTREDILDGGIPPFPDRVKESTNKHQKGFVDLFEHDSILDASIISTIPNVSQLTNKPLDQVQNAPFRYSLSDSSLLGTPIQSTPHNFKAPILTTEFTISDSPKTIGQASIPQEPRKPEDIYHPSPENPILDVNSMRASLLDNLDLSLNNEKQRRDVVFNDFFDENAKQKQKQKQKDSSNSNNTSASSDTRNQTFEKVENENIQQSIHTHRADTPLPHSILNTTTPGTQLTGYPKPNFSKDLFEKFYKSVVDQISLNSFESMFSHLHSILEHIDAPSLVIPGPLIFSTPSDQEIFFSPEMFAKMQTNLPIEDIPFTLLWNFFQNDLPSQIESFSLPVTHHFSLWIQLISFSWAKICIPIILSVHIFDHLNKTCAKSTSESGNSILHNYFGNRFSTTLLIQARAEKLGISPCPFSDTFRWLSTIISDCIHSSQVRGLIISIAESWHNGVPLLPYDPTLSEQILLSDRLHMGPSLIHGNLTGNDLDISRINQHALTSDYVFLSDMLPATGHVLDHLVDNITDILIADTVDFLESI